MIVYTAKKEDFLKDVDDETIHELIKEKFIRKLFRNPSPNEVLSWKNSMQKMHEVLNDSEIPNDSGIHVEYNLPGTSKRIDLILTGRNEAKREMAVIIELKQWSEVEKTEKDGIVKTRLGGSMVETSHPSYQAWSYKAHIDNFNETIRNEDVGLEPCAYLHNMASQKIIRDDFYREHLENAPVFISRDARKLSEFIKKFIKHGDDAHIMYRIEHGKIKPSKHLADSLASMLNGNKEFILLDDQKLVYETAIRTARNLSKGKKQTLIVNGGPGTGKSVLAINLLSDFTKQGHFSQYVTKNSAPREVFKAKLKGHFKKVFIDNLFKGSGGYYDCKPNSINILIADEAHRLNEKSGLYSNLGSNQIKEIISAAQFSIFFIDEDQRVTFKDIGRAEEIQKWAKHFKAKVNVLDLKSQFRCNGSDAYLAFTDDLLQIRETANPDIEGLDFEIKVVDSPNDLKNEISKRNRDNKARIVAGYCWDWKSKKNRAAFDIEIEEFGFQAQWNLGSDGSLWAIAVGSVEQIGCIHTCQGLEFDYVGVIIGPDFIVRNDVVVTDGFKRSKNDQSIKGFKSQFKKNPKEAALRVDAIIKNTYRTLMTRGQKGCFIYCTDKETNDYFKSRINGLPQNETAKYAGLRYPVKKASEVIPFENSVPVYQIGSSAKNFKYKNKTEVEWVMLPKKYVSTDYFVVQFQGRSRYDKVLPGDWCLFKSARTADGSERYLVRDGDNYILSDNPDKSMELIAEFVALLD
jgi:uncharacterized protein